MPLKKLVGLEKRVGGWLERSLARPGTPRDAVELVPAILDELVERAEPVGGGARSFPWDRVRVTLVVEPGRAEAARAVFEHPPGFERRLRERLERAGCDAPAQLRVKVEVEEADDDAARLERPWEIELKRGRKPSAPATSTPKRRVPEVRLRVARGTAARSVHRFRLERIHLGRLESVVDRARRTRRSNDVAFLDDGDEVNLSVSRAHAHLERGEDGAWRLFDDGSAQGTRVLRDGRALDVSRGSARGIRLNDGDEIELGQARLVFEMPGPVDPPPRRASPRDATPGATRPRRGGGRPATR